MSSQACDYETFNFGHQDGKYIYIFLYIQKMIDFNWDYGYTKINRDKETSRLSVEKISLA